MYNTLLTGVLFLKHQHAVRLGDQGRNLVGGFLPNMKVVIEEKACPGSRLHDKSHSKFLQRGDILFKRIAINNSIYVVAQQERGTVEKRDCERVPSGTETKRNTKSFHSAV